jgi:hypothetical protein
MDGINWGGLVNQNNPFASFVGGAQAGQQMKMDRERANLFAQRQQFEMEEAQRQREAAMAEQQRRQAVGGKVASGDYTGAMQEAAQAGDFDMLSSIQKMDADQKAAARARAEDLGGFAMAIKNVPYEQRKAILQQAQGTLAEYGFSPEQIATFDPTDESLMAIAAQAMDIKTALEEANRQRDDMRASEKAKADEAYRAQQLGLQRQRVGIAADSNRRGWAAFNERKRAGGFGTPGVGGVVIPDDAVEIDP